MQYKRNGAGDIYRKHGKKVECFYRGKWVKIIYPDVWTWDVLVPITEEEAKKIYANT